MQDETTQVNTPPTPVTETQAITPEQLQPAPELDLPQPNVVSNTNSVQNLTEDILKQFDATQAEQKAQQDQERLLTGISGLQPQLEGQTQALQDAEKQAGVDTFRQSLNSNNSRITQLQAEINQDDIVLAQQLRNEELRDTLLPFAQNSKARIAGDAQIVRALKNAEIGVLNARSIALQGDLYLALDTAQKAVDAKYAPIKDRITTYQAQLEAIKPFLTSAEKKELAKQEANTNLKFNEIERLQAEEKQVQALGLEAIQRGMNPSQVGFILGQNPSLAEASALFGQALQTPTEAEALELELVRARINDIRQQTQAVSGGGTTINEFGLEVPYEQPPKPSNATEKNNLGFFDRAKSAIANLDALEGEIANLGLVGQLRLNRAPQVLQSETMQKYNQAAREFTEARLRKESGAAIPDSEFENDKQTYFPQPGDKEATIRQKAEARREVLNQLRLGAGNAYWEAYGQNPNDANRVARNAVTINNETYYPGDIVLNEQGQQGIIQPDGNITLIE